jgi:hypothetical protein
VICVNKEKGGFTKAGDDGDDAKDAEEVVAGPVDAVTEEEEIACYTDVCEGNVGHLDVDHGMKNERI